MRNFGWFLVLVSAGLVRAGQIDISLHPNDWSDNGTVTSPRSLTQTAEGYLRATCRQYRGFINYRSNQEFNLQGATVRYKWRMHCAGYYSWTADAVYPYGRMISPNMTTHHSWAGSLVISTNTWIYTELRFNHDRTFTANYSYSGYGQGGVATNSGTIAETTWDSLANSFLFKYMGDGYNSTFYFDIAEAYIITAGPSVEITSPASDPYYTDPNTPTLFEATVENSAPPFTLRWESSLDGLLGESESIQVDTLSLGEHVVTATYEDDANEISTDSILVRVTVPPQIDPISNATVPAGQAYTGPTPSLNSGAQWVEWSLVDGPSGMTINAQTGVVSWPSPSYAPTPYSITIQAENPLGTDQVSWEISVLTAPEIDAIPAQTATEHVAFTSVTPSLLGGSEPIEWSLASGPAGVVVDSTTGQVSWPDPLPSFTAYQVTVRATNVVGSDNQAFSLVVQSVPQIGSIPNASIPMGQPYSFNPSLIKGNPAPSWELVEAPAGMSINSSSGAVSWPNPSPDDSTHTVTIKATNALGNHSQSYQVRVMVPPILDDLSHDTVHEGVAYAKSPSVSQGTSPLTFALRSAPGGVTINPTTGEISWAHPNGYNSPYTITVRVSNAVGNSEKSFVLTVLQQPVIKNIGDALVAEGAEYAGPTPQLYQGSPTVTWSLVQGPGTMTIDPSTGQVNWPDANYAGSPHPVVIQAENVVGADTEDWSVTVVQAPVIDPIQNQTIGDGAPFTSSQPTLTQGTYVNWFLEQGPAGMTVNSSTGRLNWPTPVASTTPYTIRLRAANVAGADTTEFELTVLAKPVIGPIANVTTGEARPYTSDPVSLQAGADPVTFSLLQGPSGMTIDPNNGAVEWANPSAVGSPHSVRLRAINAYGSDESTFSITVPIGYAAEASTDVDSAPSGTPIPIQGHAYYLSDHSPAANVTVNLEVRVRNTNRVFNLVTDESGDFEFVFTPVSGEAGSYSISAGHPLAVPETPQDTFELVNLQVTDTALRPRITEGAWYETTVNVSNSGDTPLNHIGALKIEGPNSIEVYFEPVERLDGDTALSLPLLIIANDASTLRSTITVQFSSDEGATDTLVYSVEVVPLTPELAVYPSSLEAGMVRGKTHTVSFEVYNEGGRATPELSVLIPDAPWLVMNTPEVIGVHEPNDVTVVTLTLQPDMSLPLGPYEGSVIVYGTGMSRTIPFTFNCISDQLGGLDVEAVDEFTYYAEGAPCVDGAQLTLREAFTGNPLYQNETMPDGHLLMEDLQEGYYSLDITAEEHGSYRANVYVAPGVNSRIVAFMPRQLVQYTWTVEPTEIEDVYVVTLDTTFETHVPAPVVVIEPANVDLSKMVDGQMQVNFTVSNHGLVAAEDFYLAFDEHPRYEVELLVDFNGRVGPNETIVIPAIIRDLEPQPAAQLSSSGPFLGNCDPVTGGGYYTLVCGKDNKWHKVPVTAANWLCNAYNIISGIAGSSSSNDYDPGYDYGGDEIPQGQWPTTGSGQTVTTGGSTGSGGGVITPGRPPSAPRPPSGGGSSPQKPYVTTPTITTGGGGKGTCDPCPRLMMNAMLECAYSFLPLDCPLTILKSIHDCYRSCVGFETDSTSCLMGCTGSVVSIIASCGEDLSPIGVLWNIVMCVDSLQTACDTGDAEAYTVAARQYELLTNTDLPDIMPTAEQDALAFLLEQKERLAAIADAFGYLLGDPIWLMGEIEDSERFGHWLRAYSDAISEAGDGGAVITETEREGLRTMSLPSQITTAHVDVVCDRWNRTIDYWQSGKFNSDDLDPNDSDDFIAADVAMQNFEAANDAILANEAQGYLDLFDGIVDGFDILKITLEQESEGVCAKVHLQIEQSAVMTRTGFLATLDMQNQSQTDSLDTLSVEVIVTDADGTEATTVFGIYPPVVSGIPDLNGNGSLQPGKQLHAEWLLVPTQDAAPLLPTNYYVGGNIHYFVNGHSVTIPIFPDTITVKPDANLHLKYFFERDVYGDDPYTEDTIEPSVPFVLGLMVSNTGAGSAYNMTVHSAQPTIVRHEKDKDILIDFELLDVQVGNEPRVSSLQVGLGHVSPYSSKVAVWRMAASLQGEFTTYSASFAHTDTLGDPRLSLIQSTTTHELFHAVRADRPEDDDIVDFLTNDVPDPNGLADMLHLSDGNEVPVDAYMGGTGWLTGSPVSGQVVLSLPEVPAGFAYIRVPNPGWPSYQLQSVVRSDGKVLLEDNVWTTYRMNYPEGEDPYAEIGLHVFDYGGTGVYTLNYEPSADTPPIVMDYQVDNIGTATDSPLDLLVTYIDDEGLNNGSLDGDDIQVTDSQGQVLSVILVGITSQQDTRVEAHYRILPPDGFWQAGHNGLYTVSLVEAQVQDTGGNFAASAVLGGFLVAIDPCVNVEVMSCDRVGQKRISRTEFEMTYTVTVQSHCSETIRNLRMIPQTLPSNLALVEHDVRFCSIAPNSEAVSVGTFTVRVDYEQPPDLQGQLTWQALVFGAADVNMDDRVDLSDLAEVAESWLQDNPCYDWGPGPRGDGLVNLYDFNAFAQQWFQGNP